jgi:hypothetical protein
VIERSGPVLSGVFDRPYVARPALSRELEVRGGPVHELQEKPEHASDRVQGAVSRPSARGRAESRQHSHGESDAEGRTQRQPRGAVVPYTAPGTPSRPNATTRSSSGSSMATRSRSRRDVGPQRRSSSTTVGPPRGDVAARRQGGPGEGLPRFLLNPAARLTLQTVISIRATTQCE